VNDRDLVERTLEGNQDAFRRLVDRYRNAVYGLVISYVRDFDKGEDLSQEAFIRAYYRLHTLDDRDRFGGWLRTIAANLCRMELRKQRPLVHESEVDIHDLVDTTPLASEIRTRNQSQKRVLDALEHLPSGEREAVTLYYLDDQGVGAVGKFLGISQGAVKARLHRARLTLRKEMVVMTKKTLAGKKLGPEFSEHITIRRFTDLARLTDDELRTLAQGEGMNLAYALSSADPETEALKDRLLKILPATARLDFEVYLGNVDPVHTWQHAMTSAARALQKEGAIRPKPGETGKPRGTVEIQKFADLARLTHFEIQTVLLKVDTVDLGKALMGKGKAISAVSKWVRENVSERVWGFIEIERSLRKVPQSHIESVQDGILDIVHQLQYVKAIRPSKNGPVLEDRVAITTFGDLTELTNHEIQEMLRETELLVLAVALKKKGPGVRQMEDRILANMSKRVGKLLKIKIREISSTKSEIDECREQILDTAKNLQTLGRIRPGSRKPTRQKYERVLSKAAVERIDQSRHGGRWTPSRTTYKELLPYLAIMIRDSGTDAAESAVEDISEPLLEWGIRKLGNGKSREQLVQDLEKEKTRSLREAERKSAMIVDGILAIKDGKSPREIGEMLAGR
jgi:RNA polymerase sigma factor (sigma-70 family)